MLFMRKVYVGIASNLQRARNSLKKCFASQNSRIFDISQKHIYTGNYPIILNGLFLVVSAMNLLHIFSVSKTWLGSQS
jgi:hypothetical protein